jgi:hypothetical protein
MHANTVQGNCGDLFLNLAVNKVFVNVGFTWISSLHIRASADGLKLIAFRILCSYLLAFTYCGKYNEFLGMS